MLLPDKIPNYLISRSSIVSTGMAACGLDLWCVRFDEKFFLDKDSTSFLNSLNVMQTFVTLVFNQENEK